MVFGDSAPIMFINTIARRAKGRGLCGRMVFLCENSARISISVRLGAHSIRFRPGSATRGGWIRRVVLQSPLRRD